MRPGLVTTGEAPILADTLAGGVFSIHSRIALLNTGKLSLEFREGNSTLLLILLVRVLC